MLELLSKIFSSQPFATLLGALIALAGVFIVQRRTAERELKAKRLEAIESVLMSVKAFHKASAKKHELNLLYIYHRLSADLLARNHGLQSLGSTESLHSAEALKAIARSNSFSDKADELGTEAMRYAFRLRVLFPNEATTIELMIKKAGKAKGPAIETPESYESVQDAEKFDAERNRAWREYQARLKGLYDELDEYLLELAKGA